MSLLTSKVVIGGFESLPLLNGVVKDFTETFYVLFALPSRYTFHMVLMETCPYFFALRTLWIFNVLGGIVIASGC